MTTLTRVFHPYRLSVFQLRWVLRTTRAVALQHGHAAALAAVDAAQPHVDRADEARKTYDRQRAAHVDKQDTAAVKGDIEAHFGIVYGALSLHAKAGPHSEHGRAAKELLEVTFPNGLIEKSNASYRDTPELIDDLLAVLADPAHTALVTAIGVAGSLVALRRLGDTFAPMVGPETVVTMEEVEAALDRAREAVLHAVVSIAAAFDPFGAELHVRDALLLPWRDQAEAVRATYRARSRKAKAKAKAAEADTAQGETKPEADATSTDAAEPVEAKAEATEPEADDAPDAFEHYVEVHDEATAAK